MLELFVKPLLGWELDVNLLDDELGECAVP